MKVLILAAGEGMRMKKYFPGVPKGLIPVKGKPIIEHLMKQYKGFDILLNVRAQDADHFSYLKLPLLVEETPLGNAGAVKYFADDLGDKFIVTHIDILSDLDPKDLAKAHHGCATMVVKDFAEAKSFGVVTHDGNVVTGFTRKRLINCGMYCFSKEVMQYIGAGFQDFDKDLFGSLIRHKKLYLFEHEGQWEDIGTEAYWKRNSEGRGLDKQV